MKNAWRITEQQQPMDDRLVLACMLKGEYRIVYFDGEDWYDGENDNVVKSPLLWMYIPETPLV